MKERLPSADGLVLKEAFDKAYGEKGYKEVKEEPKKAVVEKKEDKKK